MSPTLMRSLDVGSYLIGAPVELIVSRTDAFEKLCLAELPSAPAKGRKHLRLMRATRRAVSSSPHFAAQQLIKIGLSDLPLARQKRLPSGVDHLLRRGVDFVCIWAEYANDGFETQAWASVRAYRFQRIYR